MFACLLVIYILHHPFSHLLILLTDCFLVYFWYFCCKQVLDIFNKTQTAFPGAEVFTSTLDDFTLALQAALPTLSSQLAVVTEEIGDTWVYGVASDADKVAEYRALLRMRTATAWKVEEAAYRNFSRLLLKVTAQA